jgi:hypothetical protein
MDEMNGEMLNYYEANCALVRQAQEMRAQRDALQKESARNRKQADNMVDIVKRFQRDLHSCAKNIQDVKSLKENIKNLYHKYTGEDVFPVDRKQGDRARDEASARSLRENHRVAQASKWKVTLPRAEANFTE